MKLIEPKMYIDWLVFNANLNSISPISWHVNDIRSAELEVYVIYCPFENVKHIKIMFLNE